MNIVESKREVNYHRLEADGLNLRLKPPEVLGALLKFKRLISSPNFDLKSCFALKAKVSNRNSLQ
jgi:hypothetical protein